MQLKTLIYLNLTGHS